MEAFTCEHGRETGCGSRERPNLPYPLEVKVSPKHTGPHHAENLTK